MMFPHLHAQGRSYWDHGGFALRAAAWLAVATVTSVIHGIYPEWFRFTAERIVARLHRETQQRRHSVLKNKTP